MGRDKEYPLNALQLSNLGNLLIALNKFRQIYDRPMQVNSGYRPGKYNEMAGGAPGSAHLTVEACDFEDKNRDITNFILSNPTVLVVCNLYMEHPAVTPTWIHLTIRAPKSGLRIFPK